MRIGYVDSTTAHEHSLEWWRQNGQDPDRALHLVRTWAWSPWAQEVQQRLGHALHEQTAVPHRFKELAIVRVCARSYSSYELYHHLPAARGAGLDDERLEALLSTGAAEASCFDSAERACLRFVDAFDDGQGVQPDTFATLTQHFTPDQVVAIALQAGYWGCNARLTTALRVETEPWMQDSRHPREIRTEAPVAPLRVDHVEPVGRLGVPAPEDLDAKSIRWFDRWPGGLAGASALVRTWSWCAHVQAANQRVWSTLAGEHIALPLRTRALVARRISWLRFSPYLLDLLLAAHATAGLESEARRAVEGDPYRADLEAADVALLRFVDAWDSGLGVDDGVFDEAREHFDRRQLVEAQLIAGFFGTQARLATALELPLDDSDSRG